MPTPQETLQAALNELTNDEIKAAIDDETPSAKEDTDWLKYLQGNPSAPATKPNLFNGKYSILLVGGGVFVVALMLYSFFGKKKK